MTSFLQRARGAAGSFSYAQYEKEISLPTPRLCKKTIGKGDKKMKSKKAVRSALGMSVLSIALCAAMLIGTTFAWFTDTASTAVNKIQAGTLKVGIVGKEGSLDGKTLSFKNKNGKTDILWEPGATFNLDPFKIVNNGNLALKYKVVISGINGSSKLLEAIEFKVKVGEKAPVALADLDGILLPEGKSPVTDSEKVQESDFITISGHMKETAGNEYQGLSIDGVAITVYATQYTYEYDSEGKDYDKNATYYPVLDAAGLKDALVNGGSIRVDSDVVPTETLVVEKNTTLDMNGSTIANETDLWNNADGVKTWSLISARGADLTIDGNGTFQAKENDCYAVDVQDGANVVIENGTFIGNIHAVYVLEGTLTVKGGFFAVQQKYPDATKANEFVLNCYDENRADGKASIVVMGGTFVNFNPADCKAEGEHTNFVADGYSVLKQTQSNGDIWYTVVNGEAAGSQEDLKDVIGNLDENGGNVTLGSGTYTLYNVNTNKTQNTTLTLEGAGADKTTFTAGDLTVTDANGEGTADYSYGGSDVTFKNMTINVGTGDYKGFIRANALYFENCTIVGRGSYWGSGTVVFKNCTFKNDNDYLITTYAGADFTFDGCTFNSNVGKFVNAYKEQKSDITPLTFIDCTFNATKANKSAVCLKSFKGQEWNLSFTNCDVTSCNADGDADDLATGSKYYSVRSRDNNGVCPAATTVTIDGVTVWQNGAKAN